MENSKETNYLRVVRTPAEPAPKPIEHDKRELPPATWADKMRWRGINPTTAVIAAIAYATLVCAIALLLTGGVLSLL